MTSKNLYFKLMKEDIKSRLWAVSLISLGLFFLYPVWTAFAAGDIDTYRSFEEGLKWYSQTVTEWLSFSNGMTVFLMMLTGLICGLSGFSYLNSRSKVDFYHSLPVRREKLFITSYVNGILILAIPYAVSVVLAVIVGISNGIAGGPLWQTAFAAYWLHLTYFILIYTTVVVAVMMTGNLVVAFLGCLVFAFFVPLAVALINGYFGVFFHTYVWAGGEKALEWGTRISPVMEYIHQLSEYSEGQSVWAAALVSLAAAVALVVLACLLYRKRPSEAAGRAMAFPVSKPIIRILMTMISALGLGLFFWSMRESTGWAVFGVLCGAVISHCVIEIIYHFDFKKLFADKFQLIGCVLAALAFLFVFRYDMVGYDRYLPSPGDVKGAAVVVSRMSDWVSYGETRRQPDGGYGWEYEESLDYIVENMNYTDVENLLAIAAVGIEDTLRNGEKSGQQQDEEMISDIIDPEIDGTYASTIICYTLKSGRKVYREYSVNLDRIMPQIEKLCASREYLEATYPMMTMGPEDVAGIYYSEMRKENRLNKLTAEQKAGILETYQKELAAMTPGRMKTESPVGLIRFATEADEAGLQWWNRLETSDFKDYPQYRYRSNLENRSYYPVYPSFTETIALLREQQIEPGSYFKDLDIQSVTVSWYAKDVEYGELDRREIMITDPEEIDRVRQVMVGPGLRYYDQLFEMSDLDVGVSTSENGALHGFSASFPRGKAPDFIIERLMAAKGK